MIQEHNERRACPRQPHNQAIRYILNQDPTIHYHGTSQNISCSGMTITTNHLIKLATPITLRLSVPESEAFITVEGHVVRSQFDKSRAELFHVSIAFDATLPTHHPLLR